MTGFSVNFTEMFAMFVCDGLNRLPHPEDVADGNEFAEGCCPDCCAPCGALRDLRDHDLLEKVVMHAPKHLWGDDISWWKDGRVDREWLVAVWECQSQPRCCRDNDL